MIESQVHCGLTNRPRQRFGLKVFSDHVEAERTGQPERPPVEKTVNILPPNQGIGLRTGGDRVLSCCSGAEVLQQGSHRVTLQCRANSPATIPVPHG